MFLPFFSCFLQALKACKADGNAILATVPDNDANSFIKAKLSGNSWIGGNDLTKVTKPLHRYIEFRTSEPVPMYIFMIIGRNLEVDKWR